VGIGTNNPGNKLHVENTVSSSWTTRFSNTTANSNNIYFGYNNGTTSYGMYIDGGQEAAGYDIQTLGGFVVRGDGKVGIGLTNPSYNLDVSGTGRFTNTLNVNSSALAAYLYSSQSIGLRVRGGGNSQDITQFQNVGGSTVIAIDNAGKIGMNVTDPVATLDMISTTGGYSSIVQQMEIPSYGTGIIFNRSASGSYNYTAQTFRYNGSTVGGITINTTSISISYSSDYRLKENREDISDAIERVKELKPVKFNWIKEPGKSKVDGFYAHELAEVVPEAVVGEKDALDWEGNPHYQSIDPTKIVPLLTAALQQAISKIEQLETRIQILENK
jgi:hypothetical protein